MRAISRVSHYLNIVGNVVVVVARLQRLPVTMIGLISSLLPTHMITCCVSQIMGVCIGSRSGRSPKGLATLVGVLSLICSPSSPSKKSLRYCLLKNLLMINLFSWRRLRALSRKLHCRLLHIHAV